MDKPIVAVIMSTFNGEKYIKEQIDSILSQNGVYVKLYIRDDGSTDQTCNIINSYHDDRIILINDGKNLGAGLSFLTLLSFVVNNDSQILYFAFSDQDDIWLSDKLISGVNSINNLGEPMLYCSDVMIYRNGVNKGLLLNGNFYQTKPLDVVVNKVECGALTMILNRLLAERIVQTKYPGVDILNTRFHDTWSYLVAVSYGKIYCDSNSYILHRIHGDNLWGMGESLLKKSLKSIWYFIKLPFRFLVGVYKTGEIDSYLNKLGVGYIRKTAYYYLESIPDYNGADVAYIRMLANYRRSFRDKRLLLKHAAECKRVDEGKLFFKVKVLMNLV